MRPFPDVDAGRWQVSVAGGREPAWTPDGRELFFTTDSYTQFWAAPVETEPAFRRSTPEACSTWLPVNDVQGRGWDKGPDGARFIFGRNLGEQVVGGTEGLVFVLNWFEELQARVPTP